MLNIILPVFLIILLGYLIGKFKKIDMEPLVWLIIYITGPALLFASLVKSQIKFDEFLNITIAMALIIMSMFLIVLIIFKIIKRKLGGATLPLIFGNTGYLGFPIALLAFNYDGLSRAVIYSNIESIFMFSLGVYLVTHEDGFKEMFKLPFLYVIAAGILFNLLEISVPEAILSPIDMVGMATIPLALIVLGYRLTQIKVSSFKWASLMSLFRIGMGFLAAVFIVKLIPLSELSRNIVILQAAMPSAVFTMILCEKYKSPDCNLVASTIMVGTVLSIITIPFILWFLSLY